MLAHEKNMNKARVRGIALVTLMLGSLFVAMIPAVSASHVETYPPSEIQWQSHLAIWIVMEMQISYLPVKWEC